MVSQEKLTNQSQPTEMASEYKKNERKFPNSFLEASITFDAYT